MAKKKKKSKEGKKKPRKASKKTSRAPKKARKTSRATKKARSTAPKKKAARKKSGVSRVKKAAEEFGAEEWKDEPDEIVQEDEEDLEVEADFHEVDDLTPPPLEKPADDDEEW